MSSFKNKIETIMLSKYTFQKIIDIFIKQKKLNINISPYIYDIDELFFWDYCISNTIYIVFKNRFQFFDYYAQIKSIEYCKINQDIQIPSWLNIKNNDHYRYIYLSIINESGNWKKNSYIFNKIWNKTNIRNYESISNINDKNYNII